MRKVELDRASAIAGIELAAMSMPQTLGYAAIAGMPAVTGLYTLLAPLLGFAAFGSSLYLVVAADSATAAILAGGLSPLAKTAGPEYVALAGLVAAMTAFLLLLARVLKLGFIADFLSRTVLAGFLTGVGVQVAIAVLPKILGIDVASRRTVVQLYDIGRRLSETNLPSLGISAVVIAAVLLFNRYAPRVPGPLFAVAASIAASAFWDFAAHGIAVIGPVAGGLPHPTLPPLDWKAIDTLMPVAASCFLMIVTQSSATARIYALKHRQQVDENSDLLGLAAANALSAVSGSFVVNGSPTQTAIVESAGARTKFAYVTAAAMVALVLLCLTGPLQYLPKCVLGAIVFLVALHLVDLKALHAIRLESPGEFWLAAATAACVVFIGVEQGIILAMVMSLFRIVGHSYHPHTAVLVQDGSGIWTMIPARPGAVTEPGLAIYRFGAPLFYANAGRFAEEVLALAGPKPSPLRWIVVDAGAITKIDYSAARAIEQLAVELSTHGVALVFAHVEGPLQSDLDRHHLTEVIGRDHVFDKLHDAVAAYHESHTEPRTK